MSKELKIREIEEKFKDVWVVVEVTKRDKFQVPAAGRVLYHDIDHDMALEYGSRYRKQQNSEAELYYFFTGDPFPEDAAVILNAI